MPGIVAKCGSAALGRAFQLISDGSCGLDHCERHHARADHLHHATDAEQGVLRQVLDEPLLILRPVRVDPDTS
jgi:hypothetical protein